MKSLLLLKISDLFLLLKKNDFDLSKYHICFVILKNVIFYDKNLDLFCYIFLKRFSKKKTSLII